MIVLAGIVIGMAAIATLALLVAVCVLLWHICEPFRGGP